MSAQPITLDKTAQHASDELIAVTGEKGLDRQWDLADAVLAASPNIVPDEIARIRQAAVDKAGHDQFWAVKRLTDLAKTAQAWPKADRVADVALDAHLEAHRKSKTLADAKALIANAAVIARQNGKTAPSIRDVRKAAGANGVGAQPPRIDKATADEVWRRMLNLRNELKGYLRGNLKQEKANIEAFASMLIELSQKLAIAEGSVSPAPEAKPAVKVAAVPTAEKKGRVKGI